MHFHSTEVVKQIFCRIQIDLRPAEHMDGAGGGFVLKQLDIRNGLGHLEGVLLRRALRLLVRLLKQHDHGVCQVLQERKKTGGL